MQVELVRILDAHRYGVAASYTVASLVLGYASVQLGTAFARRARTVA
jgi:CrcB protein